MGTDWSESHCGTLLTDYLETVQLMPEVKPVLDSLWFHTEMNLIEYLFDVKVHMLMPNQFPCIPNWHCDFVPRLDGKKDTSLITGEKMYLWVSGEPKTEWAKPERLNKITSCGYEWVEFDQRDVHRGVKSTQHCWRAFVRAVPKKLVPKHLLQYSGLRRHSQVYLDSNEFTW